MNGNGDRSHHRQSIGDDNEVHEIIPLDSYNIEEGKLRASVKWLIAKVFGNATPDQLVNPFYRDNEGCMQMSPAVINSLTSGDLYRQAAAKIFQDQNYLQQSHGAVLQTLQRIVPDMLTIADQQQMSVTETILSIDNPIKQSAHLAMIDALMTAHMKQLITIEKAVEAVKQYTSVDKREEPMDQVDALLFWINKICLLVRDDMEKSPLVSRRNGPNSGCIVPEMEDLYEDMCDGACVCALIAFYRPHQLKMETICFNDPMGIGDCAYNLNLLREFCEQYLPWNPFHFSTEDILYLHENLQPNVNALLTDLFYFFENDLFNGVQSPAPVPTTVRHFAPIQGIPDLRQQNRITRSAHPPRVKYNVPQQQGNMTTVPNSLMNSADSLMTNRSADSLKYSTYSKRGVVSPGFVKSPTTNFGELPTQKKKIFSDATYTRSDSMPAPAGIRLALEEKRREHERKKLLESSQNEMDRQQTGKTAFFTLIGKSPANNGSGSDRSSTTDTSSPLRHLRANSDAHNSPITPNTKQLDQLNKTVLHLQEQVQKMSAAQKELARQMDDRPPPSSMSHAVSQPLVFSSGYPTTQQQLQGQQQSPHVYARPFAVNNVDTLLSAQQAMTSYGLSPPHQSSYHHHVADAHPAVYYDTQPHYAHSNTPLVVAPSHRQQQQQPSTSISPPTPIELTQSSTGGSNTFRLHDEQASASRLDPPLELNRNLTNWGITYKPGHVARPQRRTWENQTFIKSELDLVNQAAIVPQIQYESNTGYEPPCNSQPFPGAIDEYSQQQRPSDYAIQQQHGSSSRSPGGYDSSNGQMNFHALPVDTGQHYLNDEQKQRSMSKSRSDDSSGSDGIQRPSAAQFVVDGVASNSAAKKLTREMEAKREALLAKTMKRREEIDQKVEEIEAKNADRRLAEQRKQEQIEQRKLEKEMHRQKLLDEYQRRKMEQDALEHSTMTASLDASASPLTRNRGHSQPPQRPKSQLVVGAGRRAGTMQRGTRQQGGNTDETDDATTHMSVSSIAEPSLKLFSKPTPKSNRNIIINALQYSVFAGTVNNDQKLKVLEELAKSDSKHFLILFRDHKCQYRGLYSWDQMSDTAHKVQGSGPRSCKESTMQLMFKYDSGGKSFQHIPTKHLSATIDGFSLPDQYWQKPKIPFSGGGGSSSRC